MNVSKYAKQEYLNRKFDDWRSVKGLPHENLDELLMELDPKPVFYTHPMLHQKACFLLGTINPSFLFLLSMGAGKSKIALDVFRYRKGIGEISNALILVPNVVSIDNWIDEVSVHAPDLKVVGLYGSTKQRWKAIETQASKADLVVLNYQGLVYMATNPPDKKKGTGGRRVSIDKIGRLGKLFDSLIFDEIHNVKNHMSLIFNISDRIANFVKVRYGLTGTPFGRDPHDLWSQFKVIDRGETFGNTLALFRASFFNRRQNYWGVEEYKFRKLMQKKLNLFLNHKSIFYGLEEMSGIPDIARIKRSCDFVEQASAKTYYNQYIEDLISYQSKSKDEQDLQDRKSVFTKLRQISSGFLYLDADGDDDEESSKKEKVLIEFPRNPKLELLLSLISELPQDEKFIVFHDFTQSGKMIEAALSKEKFGVSRLYGGTQDKVGAVKEFKTNPKCRAFVVNSKSGGTSINIQVAKYAFFFESPVSPIVRSQTEGRIRRKGQRASKVIVYDLCMRKTVDEKILGFLAEGKDLFDAIIAGKTDLQKI